MRIFQINILIFNFLVSSTCFETEGSSLGRWLYMQLWYGTFYMLKLQSKCKMFNLLNVEVQHFILLMEVFYCNFRL